MDSLDGSSNIDVNATIGTIFGIFRRRSPEGETATDADILQAGNELVAAGYVVYGPGTVMVLAVDGQVNGFTPDPVVGVFLSHPDISSRPTRRPTRSTKPTPTPGTRDCGLRGRTQAER